MNQNFDINKIVDKYSKIDVIWNQNDKWHYYVHQEIKKYINHVTDNIEINIDALVLNAGSAGEEYGLKNLKHIHLDIVKKNIEHTENFIVSNIEDIPLEDNQFDIIICVGSVLNYSDALKSISEFSRLLKKNGFLIIEFETSQSLEYISTEHFFKSATLVKTFYQNSEEKLWVYSEKYIKNILDVYNLKFLNQHKFHIVSGAVYRLTKNSDIATKFLLFDKLFSRCKLTNRFSSNIILTYQKN